MTDKRSVGDDVLEDLDALIKSGGMGTVAPPGRSYSTPTKLGREMHECARRQPEYAQVLDAQLIRAPDVHRCLPGPFGRFASAS